MGVKGGADYTLVLSELAMGDGLVTTSTKELFMSYLGARAVKNCMMLRSTERAAILIIDL